MKDKTVVITGATSGIGEVAALRLAQQGARIVFVGRDKKRAGNTLEHLPATAAHSFILADLSLLAEQKRVATELSAEPAIDVLVNNAGALFNNRVETADGLERTFALNHMGYFTITNLLLPKLKPGARIVSVASRAHQGSALNFDDLQMRSSFGGWRAYANSKLCNILFNRALAKRLEGTGITANCLHPGFVATRFGDESGGVVQRLVAVAKPVGAITPEEGARTIIHLASSPAVEGISGEYFFESKIATPSQAARSDESAERLWEISGKIAG